MIALILAGAMLQTAPPASPPTAPSSVQPFDQARLTAAARLIDLLQIDRTLDAMFVQLAPGFGQSVLGILATNPQTKAAIDKLVTEAPENRDRMVAILGQEFVTSVKRQYPGFKRQMAQEYATAFTLDELTAISGFYSSGPGAKALTLIPQLQAKMSVAGQAMGRLAGEEAGRRAFERIEQEMLPEMKKRPAA